MHELTEAFVRPVRVPAGVPLCFADPPIARAGERGCWRLSFRLAEDVPEGADIRVLFCGGRNVKGAFENIQTTDPDADGYVAAMAADGRGIETVAEESDAGTVAFRAPARGLARGEIVEVSLGGEAGIIAPSQSLSNKMFLLFRPVTQEDLGVPSSNADDLRLIIGACLVHVTGGKPVRIRAYAPSQVQEGDAVSVLVRPEDEHGNVAGDPPGGLSVRLDGQDLEVEAVAVEGWSCVRLEGIVLPGPGLHRLEIEDTSTGFCATTNPIRILPLQDDGGGTYWGVIHGHTELSDGAGTADNYFSHMRDACGLDFGALADHDHVFETSNDMWHMAQSATVRHHQPGEFVTLLGYEWAKWRQNGDGDRCVYYLHDMRPMFRSDEGHRPAPPDLFEALGPETAMVIPHHTADVGNHCDWKDHDPEKERLVEIYSVWGNSERSVNDGNPYPVRPTSAARGAGLDAGEVPAGFVQRALELGWRVGFTGGGDDHSGHPGDERGTLTPYNYKAGLLGVHAPENTREAIWEALYARRCFATTGARIIVAFEVAGAPMGEELSISELPELAGRREIRATVHGTADIEKLEIVRNNQEVYVHHGSGPDEALAWEDDEPFEGIALPAAPHCPVPFCFYYLRVTQVDGEMAWASPVWVS